MIAHLLVIVFMTAHGDVGVSTTRLSGASECAPAQQAVMIALNKRRVVSISCTPLQ